MFFTSKSPVRISLFWEHGINTFFDMAVGLNPNWAREAFLAKGETLSDDDLNYIANEVKKVPDDKRTITTIFKNAVYKKPSIIFDVIKVFAGV